MIHLGVGRFLLAMIDRRRRAGTIAGLDFGQVAKNIHACQKELAL